MGDTRLCWHFLADRDGRPVLRDGTPLEVGRWYEHEGPLVMCSAGYHASERAIDALKYAPGPWVSLCEVEGEALEDADKLCARRRRAWWTFDATEILRLFARQAALAVIHLWDAPQTVREYLETGDESQRDAARDAATDAAWDAAWAAARDAATDAAWDAARDAAWAAARDAAWDAQDATLESMLLSEAAARGLMEDL